MSICTKNIFLKKNFVYPRTLKADISKSTRDQRSASGKLTFASFSLLRLSFTLGRKRKR